MNKAVKEISDINSETSFNLKEETKVKVTYRYVAEEGNFDILLQNQNKKAETLITTQNKGEQTLKKFILSTSSINV
ncbi:hypothetical protein [Cellulosilyticum ruminicola]|uniref:hypothetical protein n=1 Tax=Cellulosilyticum ruminicola TaxID=425254 RepID=UPI0006CF35A6|nr:hypothetical protein [Cellulosilyticum ruminicola]